MTTYNITEDNKIEIDFHGVKPSDDIRNKMKAVKIWWDYDRMIWHGSNNAATLAVAKEICGKDYALKVKIKDIVNADNVQLEKWEKQLRDYVNEVMGEDNSTYSGSAVSRSQESVWMNCFRFIAKNLSDLPACAQEHELIFEYSLSGTVHERPDVLLLTNGKAISLEFKRKEAPQIDNNKDDVAQAIRYKEWLQNHHKETRDRQSTKSLEC